MKSKPWSRRLRIILPVMLIGLAAVWWQYPRPSDRELIDGVLRRAAQGIETKNVKEIKSCVSPDYQDSEGLTRRQIHRLAMAWAREPETADLTFEDYQVTVAPPEATAEFIALVTFSGQGARSTMQLQIRMQLHKERRGLRRVWLVRSVEGHQMGRIIEGFE